MTTPRSPKPTAKTPTSCWFNSAREMAAVRRAADKVGKSVSRFLRDAAMAEAERVLDSCPHCGAGKHASAAA